MADKLPPNMPPPNMPPPKTATVDKGPAITLAKATPEWKAPRIVLTAVEGWGKTSCGAYAPAPTILMAEGETGYDTLLGSGLVPQVTTGTITSWQALLELLRSDVWAECKTLVLDAMGGIERACHTYVCNDQFNGDWGERGFASYQKGYDLSALEWSVLLAELDRINAQGVTILLLSHVKVATHKNPLGADYDRYVSDVHHKTWSATSHWADVVLFGNYYSVVETASGGKPEALKKGKGIGGTERVVYAERRDAFDAKNRYGMEPEIQIPHDPTLIWSTIETAIQEKHNAAR